MDQYQQSLEESLTSRGLNTSNPQSTYVDFATQIAKNQAEQKAQEEALNLAKQHVEQAKYQTRNEQDAQAAGLNPLLLDNMTPEQAVAQLKVIAQAKGLDISDADIQAWAKSLPPRVSNQVVETFANRFARETARTGQPAKFEKSDNINIPDGSTARDLGLNEDPNDPKIGHVPEDGMYQVVFDNQGVMKKFIPGGKEAADPTAKNDAKAKESADKQWQKLDSTVNGAFKTRSGGLGSLSTAIFRAVRAINTINSNPNLTAQDLANISQDIAGIFQGGAPTVVTAKDNDYSTIYTDLANTFRKYTGIIPHFGSKGVLSDTKEKLLRTTVDLRDSAINNIKKFVESEEPAFQSIIADDDERWQKFQDKKLNFITSGLLVPPYSKADPSLGASPLNITGIEQAEESKEPSKKTEAPSAPAGLPSLDEIKAERARRNAQKGSK